MDKLYHVSQSKNAEILSVWYSVCMNSRWTESYKHVVAWLLTMGRMKFVRPAYRSLYECYKSLAVDTFKKHKAMLHPICRSLVEKDLKLA